MGDALGTISTPSACNPQALTEGVRHHEKVRCVLVENMRDDWNITAC